MCIQAHQNTIYIIMYNIKKYIFVNFIFRKGFVLPTE